MGIEGLLNFLKPITVNNHIEQFKGKTAAIDISSWLYKGCYSCSFELHQNIETHDYLYYIQKMIQLLKGYNITPIAVFDGKQLPAKEDTEKERQRQKQVYKDKALEAIQNGDEIEARKNFSRSLNITNEIVGMVMDTLIAQNIEIIVAPYEADPQIVYLVNQGYADFAISEDSDLICYGCHSVVYKLSVNGRCDIIKLGDWDTIQKRKQIENQNIRCFLGFNQQQRIECCILSGCDYINSIKNVGIVKSVKYMYKHQNISQAIKALKQLKATKQHIPQNYEFMVKRVRKIFQFHRVYDPIIQDFATINKLPEGFFEESLIGNKFENLEEYVKGNLNIRTMEVRNKNQIDLKALLDKRIFNNNQVIQEVYKPVKKNKKEKIEAQNQYQQLREQYYQENDQPTEQKLFEQEKANENLIGQDQDMDSQINVSSKQKDTSNFQQQKQKNKSQIFHAKNFDNIDYFQMIEQEMLSTDEEDQQNNDISDDDEEEDSDGIDMNNNNNQLNKNQVIQQIQNKQIFKNDNQNKSNNKDLQFQHTAISERFSKQEYEQFIKNPLEIRNYLTSEQEFNSFMRFLQVFIFNNKIERYQVLNFENLNQILDVYNKNLLENQQFLAINDMNFYQLMSENPNFRNNFCNLNEKEQTSIQMFQDKQQFLGQDQLQKILYYQDQQQQYFYRKQQEIQQQQLYEGLTTQQIIDKAVNLKKNQGEDFKEYEMEKDEIELQQMVEQQNSEDDNSLQKLQRNFYKMYVRENLKNKNDPYLQQKYNVKNNVGDVEQQKWIQNQKEAYEQYQQKEQEARQFGNQKYKPLTQMEQIFKNKREQIKNNSSNNQKNQFKSNLQIEEEENWSDYSQDLRIKRQQRRQLRIVKFGSVRNYRLNFKERFGKRKLNQQQFEQAKYRKLQRNNLRKNKKQQKNNSQYLEVPQQNQVKNSYTTNNNNKTKFNPFQIQNNQINKINQSLDDIQISKQNNMNNNKSPNKLQGQQQKISPNHLDNQQKKSPIPIQNQQKRSPSIFQNQKQISPFTGQQNKKSQISLQNFLIPKDEIQKNKNNNTSNQKKKDNKKQQSTIENMFTKINKNNEKIQQEQQIKIEQFTKNKKIKFTIADDEDSDNNDDIEKHFEYLKKNPQNIKFEDLDSTLKSDQNISVSFSSYLTDSE